MIGPSRLRTARGGVGIGPNDLSDAVLLVGHPARILDAHDAADKDRKTRLHTLAGHLQSELIEATECSQVRAGEGNVRRAEVPQMGSVRTSTIGRPRARRPPPRRLPAPSTAKIHSGADDG